MVILEILGAIALIIGVLFSVLGVVGVLRLPDTYTRLHASGKTSVLGIIFLCLGVGFLMPEAWFKLLALSIFMIFSGPVGSHAIAAAVHRGTAATNREAMASGQMQDVHASGVHSEEEIERMMQDYQSQQAQNAQSST